MRCSVQNCINDTTKTSKINGITFHMFPKEQSLRSMWIEALGIHGEPKKHSIICSEHFKRDAFYETKSGLRKIRNGAIPMLAIKSSEDLEFPAAFRACRICLAIDVTMYHIKDYNLSIFYEEFTGIMLNPGDRLPKMVCWECVGRLMSAKRFRDKALRCHSLLAKKFRKKNCMTVRDVKLVNRSWHKLQSPLQMKCFRDNYCDLMICDDEINEADKEEECDDNLSKDNNDNDDFLPVVMLQVMDEKIFMEKYPGFVSEDIKSLSLSEAYKEKKVKKRKYEEKSDKAKKVPVKISFTDADTPSTTMEKNRINEQVGVVRRRRKKRAPGVIVHWGADNPDRPKQVINCEQCDAQLDSDWMYSQHFRVAHPGLNRTKSSRVAGNCMCEQCGKMFACKALLMHHMSTHTGEKRYKCGFCDKRFTNKHSLGVHQSVHGAEVPTYQCPYCEKEFIFYQNCNRHIKTVHEGVKQFQCEICGKEFTSAWGQREHVDHVHLKKPRPKRLRTRHDPAYSDW